MSSIEDQEPEAAEACTLATGAEYRAALRGHTRMLSALRQTQLEHYAEHKADAAEIKAGVAEIVRLVKCLGGNQQS